MVITVTLRNDDEFYLFYRATSFKEGVTVTAYIIYPDLTKSEVMEFTEMGDGIYVAVIPHTNKSNRIVDKYGILVKEDGVPKEFEIITLIK